ncbi:hypothetical protein [Streptomyces halstedii]|uniref:Secreted protein n=1 Tax=Streptomyces halstedii TaxID=1944 RepID=A0A6N9U5B2_STRHA|nr:hypothetical protein [Streptomyces halstedii]NEA17096.1 hypothetical protein [Streptomyces halstedii]
MKRMFAGALTAATVATAGLALTAGTAQAHTPAPQQSQVASVTVYDENGVNITGVCQNWQDTNTFGVRCNTDRAYYAWAKCRNGKTVTGVVASYNNWSYAYCSSVRSSLQEGKGKWA